MVGIVLPQRRNWTRHPPIYLRLPAATALWEKSSTRGNEPYCPTLSCDEHRGALGRGIWPRGRQNEREKAGSTGQSAGRGCSGRLDADESAQVRGDHAYRCASKKGRGTPQP